MTHEHERPIRECMSTDIQIVDAHCLIVDAIDIMRAKNIGSLLVRDTDGSMGIFTERDFLYKVNLREFEKKDWRAVPIGDVMTKNAQTVDAQEPYTRVIERMHKSRIRHMPVTEQGAVVGIVSLRDLMAFHQSQLAEINRQLSSQASQLAARSEKLRTIMELAQKLVSDMESRELLRHITCVARDLVSADKASVMLLKEEGGRLSVTAAEFIGAGAATPRPSIDIDNSLTGWVIQNRQPVLLCGKTNADERFPHIPANDQIKYSMCVPIMYRGVVKGTLNLAVTRPGHTFTDEHLALAVTLANHVSVALENSSMYKELQAMYLRSLRVANERMNKMNEALRIANEKIDNEIKTVAIVQQGLLPNSLPTSEQVDIAAIYLASTTVGGDYYDCIQMDDGNLGIVIADVTGHGLPAAFVMTMLKILLFYLNQQKVPLEQTVATINDMFTSHIPISTFPSLIYGILNPRERVLTFVNAGHEPIIVLNAKTGRRELHYAQSSLLGIEPGVTFRADTIHIEKGDRLLLYTDGILDAMNKNRESFGRERFIEVAAKSAAQSPKEIITSIIGEVNTFCEGTAFSDDVTFMVLGFP